MTGPRTKPDCVIAASIVMALAVLTTTYMRFELTNTMNDFHSQHYCTSKKQLTKHSQNCRSLVCSLLLIASTQCTV
ncbi:hypothetical protein BC830DRAFT_1112335 [Chytriomyces sp. MP71]|nr:hypothetical protein BC830DRAFT_1112335 [Chytriomyces sp. MP71]